AELGARLMEQQGACGLDFEGGPGICGAVGSPESEADTEGFMLEGDPGALAAHYVETIDLNKRSGLYLTFYSDGDKRERGSALVRLKRLYRAAGLPLEGTTELPDYLPVMLEFAATAPDGRGEIVLRESRASLELVRLALRDLGSPYADLLDATCAALGEASAAERALAGRLAAGGPPQELVGLEPFAPPEAAPSTGARR
ncbi:MAG TPA: nitrate reductase molybdenum cofactor assembly chaperone, partial [Solirubrobacterales bacterium]|nr:nitrate reductase molybdenum cofactor assembly chaperone [Solirubrobacterales bacterium]